MAAFVGRFDVDVTEVAVFEGVQTCQTFGFVIGIPVSRCAFHFDDVHIRGAAYSFKKVYGGNHRAFKTRFVVKRSQRGFHAASPEPDAVCGRFAVLDAFYVYGVVRENLVRLFINVCEQIFIDAGRKILADDPARNIVRRSKSVVRNAAVDNKTVAVTYARIKMQYVGAEIFRNAVNEDFCLGGGYFAGAVIEHSFVFKRLVGRKRHEIHTI